MCCAMPAQLILWPKALLSSRSAIISATAVPPPRAPTPRWILLACVRLPSSVWRECYEGRASRRDLRGLQAISGNALRDPGAHIEVVQQEYGKHRCRPDQAAGG